MQRCPRCGAPNAAPTCWHCGLEAAIGGLPPASEEPPAASGAIQYPPLIERPPAIARRRRTSPLLLTGGVAAVLFVALSMVFAAGSRSRSSIGSVDTSQAATVAAPVPDAPVVQPTELPTWVGRRRPVWGSDGTKTVSFSLDAIADVTTSSRTRPQLVARCLSRATEMYVVTGPLSFEHQTGSHTVRVQVDDEPEQTEQWVDSDGGHELFAPDGAQMTDRLAGAHRLRVGFTPFNAKPVTAEFIVEGFDELAPLLSRTCGRRLPSKR